MIVSELITELQKVSPDATVIIAPDHCCGQKVPFYEVVEVEYVNSGHPAFDDFGGNTVELA